MTILTREQILKARKRKTVDLPIPELGGQIRLQALSAQAALAFAELSQHAKANPKGEVDPDLFTMLLEASMVDEDGKPIFEAGAAKELLPIISLETMMLLMESIPGLKEMKAKIAAPATQPARDAADKVAEMIGGGAPSGN